MHAAYLLSVCPRRMGPGHLLEWMSPFNESIPPPARGVCLREWDDVWVTWQERACVIWRGPRGELMNYLCAFMETGQGAPQPLKKIFSLSDSSDSCDSCDSCDSLYNVIQL